METELMLDLEDFVITRVLEERRRQDETYGEVNDTIKDGTGPHVQWLEPITDYVNQWPGTNPGATRIEEILRFGYEQHSEKEGNPTWMHLVLEEIAEAFKESDLDRLEEELVQVTALCISWLTRIKARQVGAV